MTAYTPVLILPALQPDGSFCINPSGWIDNRVLAANTAETFTVPVDANSTKATRVYIEANADIWVGYTFTGYSDVTAVVPSADTTDGTGVELNPVGRFLGQISKISIISASTCLVSLAYYR